MSITKKTNWQTKKLGEVCDILDNKRKPITKKNRTAGEYPYYGATGILDYVDDYIFNEKLILIGEDGAKWESGEHTAFIAEGKYWVNNHAHVIRPHRDIILDNWIIYFFYFNDLTKHTTGLTVPKLNQANLRNIEIPLPPLPEQRRIVKILDEVFADVGKAKENAKKNLENAKELFESYLNNIFKNPGGDWEKKKLVECFRLKSGDMLTSKMMKKGEFPVYGGNGITGLHNRHNLSGNNVIIGRVGALCGNARNTQEKIWLTDNAFRLVDHKYEFDNSFLTYLLNCKNLRSFARQSAQPVISNSSLKNIILQFPKSIYQQKAIVKKLDVISVETKKLESIYQQKLTTLEELKKSVLQKAFKGKL